VVDGAGHVTDEREAGFAPGQVTIFCRADFDNSGILTTLDVIDIVNAWLLGDSRADVNSNGHLDIQDIFDFLAAWFAGCP
jgi:hypothetical protein